MAREISYETLLNQHNILVTQVRELNEQMSSKDAAWKEYEINTEVMSDHARQLCEKILAKDRSEMTLGNAKSWHSYSTDELILRAIESFDKYVVQNTEIMKNLLDIAEERRVSLRNLEDQIATMMESGNIAISSVESVLEQAEISAKEKEVKSKAPNFVKKAASEGKIEVIIEEDTDRDASDLAALVEAKETAVKVQLTPKSIPVTDSEARKIQHKKAEQKAVDTHIVNVKEITDSFKETDWIFIKTLGEKGISRYPEIEAYITEHNPTILGHSIRRSAMSLTSAQVIEGTTYQLPLSATCKFYKLTDLGVRLYKTQYGEKPVKSQIDEIIAEHDNPEHGIGIYDISRILENTGRYKSVSINTKLHNKPIPVVIDGVKKEYIPDIVAVTDKYTEYVEYERGTHKQVDFSEKCEKMVRVTRFLNFVVPNKTVGKKIVNQINRWLETKDISKLKNYYIKVGTAADLRDNVPWRVEYQLKSGKEPIKNTL